MAESPGHKLGQMIGQVLEALLVEPLDAFCAENGLYLDRSGPRRARKGSKVSWVDRYGNTHDLDFVIERGGDADHVGIPLAFIEVAWRRYTKHSKAKAQEIQGAIEPLIETYSEHSPFIGVVLAGEWTGNAIRQLESLGFVALHFSYVGMKAAFAKFGLDIAFDETTPDAELARKVAACERDHRLMRDIGRHLLIEDNVAVDAFVTKLRQKATRTIARVTIVPLFGQVFEFTSIASATDALPKVERSPGGRERHGFEVRVEYGNGDRVEGRFDTIDAAHAFLGRIANR